MSDVVVALTNAGATAIARAIGGEKLQIVSAHFGNDLINTYSQERLETLTEVVSNGVPSSVYNSDASVISYLYPTRGEIQLRVNLGTDVGDFNIGNWGLVDNNGTLLFIVALASIEYKSKTGPSQVGGNRVYVLNIPLTSNTTNAIDFSVLNVDAAALPEVSTEANLPAGDTSAYPVFHVQDYNSTNAPCLASRVENEWFYYPSLESILARDNTWTGTNTYTKPISTNGITASSGTLSLNGSLSQSAENMYVNTNQRLVRGWDGTITDHVVRGVGVGFGTDLTPFFEYYNTAGSDSGATTFVQLATKADLANINTGGNAEDLLASNNTWTGTNTFNKTVTVNSITASSGKLNLNGSLVQSADAIYINTNQRLVRGWNGDSTDYIVRGVGVDDVQNPFFEYYSNSEGSDGGATSILQLATKAELDSLASEINDNNSNDYVNLLPLNNTWTGTNTYNESVDIYAALTVSSDITAESNITISNTLYTDYISANSRSSLTINNPTLVNGVLETESDGIGANVSRSMNGDTSYGGYCWGKGLTVYGYGQMAAKFTVSDVGSEGGDYRSGVNITGMDYGGNTHQWYFHWDDYLYDGNGNRFIKQSDLAGYALSSNIAFGIFDGSQGSTTSGTIVGGTWLRVGNTLIQNLVIDNIGGGTVTYPYAFSGNVNQVVVHVQDGTGSNSTFSTGNIQLNSVGIHASGGGGTGRMHFTVSGPWGT